MKPEDYILSLPARTVAKERVWDVPRLKQSRDAISYPHVQANSPVNLRWMLFDVDHSDSWLRIEASRLPVPTYIAVNRQNGHSHVGYLFENPVCLSERGRDKPINFLHDVERGFRNRMGGDPSFSGHLTKNPCHPLWDTDWNAKRPYRLDELNDSLDRSDKQKATADLQNTIIGRNFTVFEAIRQVAYRQVIRFKKDCKSQNEFMEFLVGVAQEVNRAFPVKLDLMEIRCIAKSVAKWTWGRFDVAKSDAWFSARQAARIKKRWAGHVKPWEALGMSERTFYRRRAAGEI